LLKSQVIKKRKGDKMTKFYTMGCYTDKGLAGFVNNPSTNRQAATKALLESGGAKMSDYSLLRGTYDFIAVCEGTFEQMAAAKMVAVSSGTVNNFTILESADLNKIADTAKKMSSTYKEPGK
tara:strand:- start:147 stop:512 length:366 start_codon:yes stop_codon:yes gene_type:complete